MSQKKSFSFLRSFIKKYQKDYLKGLLMTICSALLASLTPLFIKEGIEKLENGADFASILYIGLAIGFFGVSRSILLYFGRNKIVITGRNIEKDIREKVFEKILITRSEFFDKEGTGKISSQLINDVENIRMMLGFGGMIISHITPLFIFSIIAEVFISPALAILSLVPLSAIPLTVIVYEKKFFELSEDVQEKISKITDFSQETISKIKVVKNFTIEEEVEKRFNALSDDYRKTNLELSKKRGLFESIIVFLSFLSLIVVILAGIHFMKLGKITKGDLAAFVAYQLILIWPAMATGYLFVVIQRGLACLGRIRKILEQPEERTTQETHLFS